MMPTPTPTLNLYTIYDHPKDFPAGFVVRQWSASGAGPIPGPIIARTKTLEDARAALPGDLYCLDRQEGDDPTIVETWL